jgi:hypothetical protein
VIPPLPPARAEPEIWLPGKPTSLHLSVSRPGCWSKTLAVFGEPFQSEGNIGRFIVTR